MVKLKLKDEEELFKILKENFLEVENFLKKETDFKFPRNVLEFLFSLKFFLEKYYSGSFERNFILFYNHFYLKNKPFFEKEDLRKYLLVFLNFYFKKKNINQDDSAFKHLRTGHKISEERLSLYKKKLEEKKKNID